MERRRGSGGGIEERRARRSGGCSEARAGGRQRRSSLAPPRIFRSTFCPTFRSRSAMDRWRICPGCRSCPTCSPRRCGRAGSRLNPKTAERLGIQQGDLVEIASQQGSVRAPAVLSPGIAPDVVAMPVGQGHENFGRFASGRGANPLSILAPLTEPQTGSLAWAATRVKMTRVGGPEQAKLILVRGRNERLPARRRAALAFVCMNAPPRAEEGRRSRMPHKWGMVVDLDRCTGCEACVVACHAENNIPTAGDDQAARGRAKHWIRVERYWEGDFPNAALALSAGAVPAVRRRALRAGLPHLCELSHARGAERAGLQPLHRHALLRQCLPL